MANQQDGISKEALERLQSIIRTLQGEKDALARRLTKANQDKISKLLKVEEFEYCDDAEARESYIYMREPGILWSSSELASRLKQPPSNRPVPFTKVYVCDFEMDFISKDNTDELLRPIQMLKN